jgi:predicted nucleic acid-binding protein
MEIAFAIDTNIYVASCRKEEAVVALFKTADRIYIPIVVIAELRAGFTFGLTAIRNEAILTQFLNTSRVAILPIDDQTTHFYANLYCQMRRKGTPIPTNDLWIAAIVVQHQLPLYTQDRHFDAFPQIPRL